MGHELSAGVGQANRAGNGRRLYPVEKGPLPSIFLLPELLSLLRVFRAEGEADSLYLGLEPDVLVEEVDSRSRVPVWSLAAAGHFIFRLSFADVESEKAAVLFDHFFLKGIQFFPSNILWHFTHMP